LKQKLIDVILLLPAIMRCTSMMQENLVQLVPVILKSLTEKLLLVAKVRFGNICGMSGLYTVKI